MSNILIGILVGLAIHSIWTTIWLIIYLNSKAEPDWMVYLAGGFATCVAGGIAKSCELLYEAYWDYGWKAMVINKNGDKYYCESNKLDEIRKLYDVKPALDFVETIEYKPYKPKLYSGMYQRNPRYVHRNVACKYPKLKYHFRDAEKMPNCGADMRDADINVLNKESEHDDE